MRQLFVKTWGYFIIVLLTGACIDPYQPPEIIAENHYLVVDGYLNIGRSSQIRLSTTQNLTENNAPPVVSGAKVSVEIENGETFEFTEIDEGTYELPVVDIPLNRNCRLSIQARGENYLSDFVPVGISPPIDSVNWKVENGGVQVYVTTHDPTNNTQFYSWSYTETWQFTSAFNSNWIYDENDEIVPRRDDIYNCWNSENSTSIFIASSIDLKEDVIFQYPLNYIQAGLERLRIKHSTLVKQRALTKEAYEYYESLKNNTENLGSLFDPQPFQLTGNIRNENNPEEPVIGYFSASTISEKRIFIRGGELPFFSTTPYVSCEMDTIMFSDLEEQRDVLLLIDEFYSESGFLIGYLMGTPFCVDCSIRGSTVRPDFWQ